MIKQLALAYEDDSLLAQAEQLASKLRLPIDNRSKKQLLLTRDKLVLKLPGLSPLYPDFTKKSLKKRRQQGKKQGLVRACKPAKGIRILDATAGWGKDAAVLASFGANVLMLERHPVIAALLLDALQRSDAQVSLNLINTDAIDYLQSLRPENYPEVIYVDPMHPPRQKTALVKKAMQVLQQIAGPDEDALILLRLAQEKSRLRAVVKWPPRLPPLLLPTTSIVEKTVRFDVYLKAS